MSAALQIYYSGFDTPFFKLPPPFSPSPPQKEERTGVRRHHCCEFKSPHPQPSPRLGGERESGNLGLRLKAFPHQRLKGYDRYRLRVGDYRIIYTFDAERNILHLLAVGNRREIYRDY